MKKRESTAFVERCPRSTWLGETGSARGTWARGASSDAALVSMLAYVRYRKNTNTRGRCEGSGACVGGAHQGPWKAHSCLRFGARMHGFFALARDKNDLSILTLSRNTWRFRDLFS